MSNHNILEIKDLHVYYGQSHALQGVSLSIGHNDIMTIVGRNGMGKTTLCNTIIGFQPPRTGSITANGQSIYGLEPFQVANQGIRYVPQGRRIWPSLSVHDHLKLAEQKGADKAWNIERVYSVFPRLAERKKNGGNQLSGGEQQMLAIGRALLGNPKLIIMDEPTEGLAPVIVEQVEALLQTLVTTEDMSILLIEQNLGVALALSDRIAIMVNGKIGIEVDSTELASNPEMQQHYLGVSGGH